MDEQGGPVVLTGAVLQPLASCGVSPFQLTQWYCAIKLEERLKGTGMKAFRKSVRVFACKHLGLKSSTPHAAVRERIRTVLREGGFPLREDREAEAALPEQPRCRSCGAYLVRGHCPVDRKDCGR